MKRLWKAVRYSGVGVFFAGIIMVLQGCTEREGAAALVLLFLLQFCSGPAAVDDMVATIPAAPCTFPDCFDPFTFSQTGSEACNSNTGTAPDGDTSIAFSGGRRFEGPGGTGTATLARTIDAGELTVSVSGGACDFAGGRGFVTWFGLLDFSSVSTIRIPILSVTNGPITSCKLFMRQSPTTDTNLTHASISAAGNIDVDITSITSRDQISQLEIGTDCALPSDASVVIGPVLLLP